MRKIYIYKIFNVTKQKYYNHGIWSSSPYSIYTDFYGNKVRALKDIKVLTNKHLCNKFILRRFQIKLINKTQVEKIDIDDKLLFSLMKIAHDKDITLNELCNSLLRRAIERRITFDKSKFI